MKLLQHQMRALAMKAASDADLADLVGTGAQAMRRCNSAPNSRPQTATPQQVFAEAIFVAREREAAEREAAAAVYEDSQPSAAPSARCNAGEQQGQGDETQVLHASEVPLHSCVNAGETQEETYLPGSRPQTAPATRPTSGGFPGTALRIDIGTVLAAPTPATRLPRRNRSGSIDFGLVSGLCTPPTGRTGPGGTVTMHRGHRAQMKREHTRAPAAEASALGSGLGPLPQPVGAVARRASPLQSPLEH